MNKILITGFEPFDGETINPSWELAKSFHNKEINGHLIIAKQLPTVFYESSHLLLQLVDELQPNIIICIGQAGGSTTIRLEKVAINLNDARIPDNKNNHPIDEVILCDGETAYFSTLPLRALYDELKSKTIPVSISLSAGSYVCNHVFYHLMHHLRHSQKIGGFIHIPYCKEQVTNKPTLFSMELSELEDAFNLLFHALTKH